jgi:hypothetical protein
MIDSVFWWENCLVSVRRHFYKYSTQLFIRLEHGSRISGTHRDRCIESVCRVTNSSAATLTIPKLQAKTQTNARRREVNASCPRSMQRNGLSTHRAISDLLTCILVKDIVITAVKIYWPQAWYRIQPVKRCVDCSGRYTNAALILSEQDLNTYSI